MDLDKFNTLAELVREARLADKAAFDAMGLATAAWKSANETLTARQKVLDGYVAQSVAEAISTRKDTAP